MHQLLWVNNIAGEERDVKCAFAAEFPERKGRRALLADIK